MWLSLNRLSPWRTSDQEKKNISCVLSIEIFYMYLLVFQVVHISFYMVEYDCSWDRYPMICHLSYLQSFLTVTLSSIYFGYTSLWFFIKKGRECGILKSGTNLTQAEKDVPHQERNSRNNSCKENHGTLWLFYLLKKPNPRQGSPFHS